MSRLKYLTPLTGLRNSTRPLVFTSASGCRASENCDISSENYFFLIYSNSFSDAGQVPILRYFETWLSDIQDLEHFLFVKSCINVFVSNFHASQSHPYLKH